MGKQKQKTLPYVYIDIDAEADGNGSRNREVRMGANCSVFLPTWPTKCPFFRGYVDPPQEGDECASYHGGDCMCREVRIEAMRRFREYIDETLAEIGA